LILMDLNPVFYFTLIWIGCIIVFFIYGNRLLSKVLDIYLPWSKYGMVRFFGQLLLGVVYSLALINLCYLTIKGLLTTDPPTTEQLMIMNLYGVFITIPIISISFGVHFLKAWKKSELESERLQKESIKSQLDALKNHLDPHFLFNNLNILSALIDNDKAKSKEFLDRFAEVYRFLLKSKGSELVSLSTELEFLQSYMYLIHSRFGDNVKLDTDLHCDTESVFLPPLTLQMLFENGIKHNIISSESPLNFSMTTENDEYLILKNNLQLKQVYSNSNKTGLNNIKNRYSHFTDLPVIIDNNTQEYTVKVPLLEIEEV